MNWILMLWPMAGAACLTLALVNLGVWLGRRDAWANLLFSMAAIGAAFVTLAELMLSQAATTAEYAVILRWAYLPIWFLVVSLIGFVYVFFGTGRTWLALSSLGLWTLALAVNFLTKVNLVFTSMTGLRQVEFGDATFVIGEGVLNPWRRIGQIGALLLLAFVADASITLWRKGERRRAVVVGGGIVFFILVAGVHSALVEEGLLRSPYVVDFCFLAIVLSMGSELSRDLLRAAQINRELRKSEAELRESEQRLQLATDSAGAGLWRLDLHTRSYWVTPKTREIFGFSPDETVTFDRYFRLVHPEDREQVQQAVEALLQSKQEGSVEYRILRDDGSSRWIASRGRLRDDKPGHPAAMLGVSVDITSRRQEQRRFHLIVELSPNGVVLTDSKGVILLINRHLEKIFGYDRDELIGQPIELLVPGHFRGEHVAHGNAFHAASPARPMGAGEELVGRRKDGGEFPVEVATSPMEDEEGPWLLSAIVDISRRKKAEMEAAQHRMELAHLTRVTTLSELSGSLAHELNQPLGIILSNAQAAQELLAQNPPDVTEVGEILSDIVAADRRAGEVIQRLRALLKRGEITVLPLSLDEIIEEVLRLIRADLIGRGMTVVTDLAPNLPRIIGDRVQLQQLLLNLIINAADAMTANAPGARRLHLVTASHQGMVCASVRDEGSGLPENIENLFQPFFTTKPQGLGLGLSICRSIITAHHGRIWAEPHPERGAVFHFELPIVGTETKP